MVTVPAIVLIPEGATTATFPIATEPVHGNKDRAAEIDATHNGITQTATLTIAPPITAGSSVRKPIARCASLVLEPCLTVAGLKIATEAITITEARYSFYTPELQLLAETAYSTEPAKTIEYEYIWFGGQPVAQIETATNTVHYYFNDHLGTPILTSDSTGVVDWRVEREPYGKIYSVRVGADRHRPLSFPGQEDDGRSELSHNIFRWYRSGWGRYTQADPIGVVSGSTLFSYSSGNPLGYYDPLGLWVTGGPTSGTKNTVVCDGNGGLVPFIPNYGDQKQKQCFGACLEQHEQSHLEDMANANPGICTGKPKGTSIIASSELQGEVSEVKAFQITVNCFYKRLSEDSKDGGCCEAYILQAVGFYEDLLAQHKIWQANAADSSKKN
jgi:RHS repeat-associated protein